MATGLRKGLTSYGDDGFSLFLRRAFIKAMGYSDDALSRPIVGIVDTSSAYNACHGNVPQLMEAAKRGVMLAGGMPMSFPTISIHEAFAHPTSMFLRNLMAMDTEEMVRGQPMDAVVMIGGCDKTVPAQLMAAASLDIPAISLVTGPMLVGHYKGEVLGACTDCRRFWARHRAGEIGEAEMDVVNGRLAPTPGTCMVMGTASTMACIAEALGMALPGSATIPATHADRLRAAEQSGAAAVAAIHAGGRTPADILTPAAFRNAQVVLQAIGGSTNGVIHLAAIAGRRGIKLDLDAYDRLGRDVPVLIDLKPTGEHYMEHFHWAGGVPRLMRELRPLLDGAARTVAGGTLADAMDAAEDVPGQTVIPGETRAGCSRGRATASSPLSSTVPASTATATPSPAKRKSSGRSHAQSTNGVGGRRCRTLRITVSPPQRCQAAVQAGGPIRVMAPARSTKTPRTSQAGRATRSQSFARFAPAGGVTGTGKAGSMDSGPAGDPSCCFGRPMGRLYPWQGRMAVRGNHGNAFPSRRPDNIAFGSTPVGSAEPIPEADLAAEGTARTTST